MNSSCLGSNLVPAEKVKPKPAKVKKAPPTKRRWKNPKNRGLTPPVPGMRPMINYSTVRQRKQLAKERSVQTREFVTEVSRTYSRRSRKIAM